MHFFRDILEKLHEESTRLPVTGPQSQRDKLELVYYLATAIAAYKKYRKSAADEERVGG